MECAIPERRKRSATGAAKLCICPANSCTLAAHAQRILALTDAHLHTALSQGHGAGWIRTLHAVPLEMYKKLASNHLHGWQQEHILSMERNLTGKLNCYADRKSTLSKGGISKNKLLGCGNDQNVFSVRHYSADCVKAKKILCASTKFYSSLFHKEIQNPFQAIVG